MKGIRQSVGLFSIILLTLATIPSLAIAKGRDFSKSEMDKLERGGLVKRQTVQERGGLRLTGGTSWQIISASPEDVWKTITNTNKYKYIFPFVVSAKLLKQKGSKRIVLLEHAKGPLSVSYALLGVTEEDKKELTFQLDTSRPHDIKAAWGFFTVRPWKDGKSILSYGIMLDTGDGFFKSMLREQISNTVLNVPRRIRRYIHEQKKT
ncbi:MAG: SRPBCC family protein [Myxococcales bacterium]|nr:MAG: SRPBCC family protein [Myxococcales bacterium]